ncbi:MAG: hypothetical protein MRZ79_11190 [Bacteroidia bacterium]|nr:hypothetical protein [Bacteroidia bacterium]
MLFFIFTKKRLLAGIQNPDNQIKTVKIKDQWYHSYEGKSIPEVIEHVWPEILSAYNKAHGKDSSAPIAISLPANLENSQKENIHNTLKHLGGERFNLYFEDNLASSFIQGLVGREELENSNNIVLEALDDYLNLWTVNVGNKGEGDNYKGREAFFDSESIVATQIKEIGPSTGRSRLMSELIQKFQRAGLNLNLDSQTELAHQLMAPSDDFTFGVLHETDDIFLEGRAKFSREDYENLYSVNREKLSELVATHKLDEQNIARVFLLGQFFRTEVMENFVKHDLSLGKRLVNLGDFSPEKEFKLLFKGLAKRTEMVLESENYKAELEAMEAKRREEEEKKREQVKAELQAKDARESLFDEIKETCVNPTLQEEYEHKFIPRGEQLGIPDVVIKWNISEILSKITLTEEAQTIGIIEDSDNDSPDHQEKEEEESPFLAAQPLSTNGNGSDNGHHHYEGNSARDEEPTEVEPEPEPEAEEETNQTQEESSERVEMEHKVEVEGEPVREIQAEREDPKEETPEPEPEPEETREEVEEEPVFVLSPAERNDGMKTGPVLGAKPAPVIALKKDEPVAKSPFSKEKNGKQRFSLGDIFSLKSDLKDKEFITKVVSFKADSVLQTLRLLKEGSINDQEQLAAFKKLHQKERAYYSEVSEISESKEGLYFYRPFIERNSLKNYLINNGFTKKERVESLSSNELKFILMVFKEVRSLSQPHGDLSEENIIVLEKRKWGLQKNVEITFVGFTSEDVSNNDMVEATHKAFSKVMGETFYNDFRKKFQL